VAQTQGLVEVSIGAIEVTVESPVPAPVQVPGQDPVPGTASTQASAPAFGDGHRLQRHYLRI